VKEGLCREGVMKLWSSKRIPWDGSKSLWIEFQTEGEKKKNGGSCLKKRCNQRGRGGLLRGHEKIYGGFGGITRGDVGLRKRCKGSVCLWT